MIKRILLIIGGVVIVGPVVAYAWAAFFMAQRADYGWSPHVANPAFTTNHPRVVVDQAHCNASTAGFASRYWPFARLLRADGYDVEKGTSPFTQAALQDVDVLVIANAAGSEKIQWFGMNIPIESDTGHKRSDPAFTAAEIAAVRAWVENGGSLLLIADHAPMGEAAAGMGEAFGVTMYKGFVEVPNEVSDPLLFSRDNGRLGAHPIINGSSPSTTVSRVMTFTGQSLASPPDAAILLRLPANAEESVANDETGEWATFKSGPAQALAMDYGRGRVVVLGEAAMLTAQVSNREPFGMNMPDNDNEQFALNTMHWLSRIL